MHDDSGGLVSANVLTHCTSVCSGEDEIVDDLLLTDIKGRHAGESTDKPDFAGVLRADGSVRIDCHAYPGFWMQFSLPEEVTKAWQAAAKKKSRNASIVVE